MKSFFTLFFSVLFFLLSHNVQAQKMGVQNAPTSSSKKITSEAGLNIPQWGIAIDAAYDNRLDSLIPGYKILNVILSNRSPSSISLDPRKDRWYIVDNISKKIFAINHLRFVNEKLWLSLPSGLRDKLEYPQTVHVGNSTKIDLFFPATIDLGNFREIGWESAHFKREFNLVTAAEKNSEDDKKGEPLPETPTYQQSIRKYDDLDPLLKKAYEHANDPPQIDMNIKKDPPQDTPPPDLRDIPAL